jgi:hypothetical protein
LEGGEEKFRVFDKINDDGNGKIKQKNVVEVEAVEGRSR